MAGRILVIRGGAIGDFVLTLPAIGLLREAFPDTHIELLGYQHIVALAVGRHYADASRSIEYGPLSGFFNPKSELDPQLSEYFAGFDQVISYLFDPDGFFTGNLRRAGVRNLIQGNPKIGDHAHAAIQLALPLQQLALYLDDPAAHLFPTKEDLAEADKFLGSHSTDRAPVALHPGSGSERKNWPLDRWIELTAAFLSEGKPVLVIGGESDSAQMSELRARFPGNPHLSFVEHLPLPALAALLFRCALFVGHDSGISHIAAATGIPCVLLFGPTDPAIWAPGNEETHIVTSPTGDMTDITLDSVRAMVDSVLANA
jgi:heptosyltransferase-2